MNDYILLMFNDATDRATADDPKRWQSYLTELRGSGQFGGGSAIGSGERLRKGQAPQPASDDLDGFIRISAESIKEAKRFLDGNPVYEGGGTVDIRELPRD